MQATGIQWTTFSANPLKYRRKSDGKVVWGCVKKSPGCANCYAEKIALRYDRGRLFNRANMDELEPFLDEAELRKMLTANRVGGVEVAGSRVFVGDMTDVFGAWVPDALLDRLFAVFAVRRDVTWQVLTKRAERMRDYFADDFLYQRLHERVKGIMGYENPKRPAINKSDLLLPNVWLGVSCEDQQRWNERVPILCQTPAAVRFVSAEPLFGPVDGRTYTPGWKVCNGCGRLLRMPKVGHPDCDCGRQMRDRMHGFGGRGLFTLEHLDWVIVGSESGPGRRPMKTEWAVSVAEQCRNAGVSFFMKQMDIDGKVTGEIEKFPVELSIREFPECKQTI